MKYRIPAVALSLVLALGGCRGAEVPAGAADNSETWKIGISFPTTDLIYRETMMELLKEYEKDHPEVDFIIRDGESSQRRQNRDVLDMLEESVDGIILIPYTMEAPVPVIRYANEKNVPVLILDNEVIRSSTARTIGFVGADHEKMGEQAAELLVKSLEKRFPEEASWNVIYLTGVAESSGALDRDEGIRAVLDQNPRVQVIGTYNGEFTDEKAQSIMEDCLNVYPEIHGVICQNDLMAEGCVYALEAKGMAGSISVIGIDGQRSVAEKIAEGEIDGTVWQNPEMAVDAVKRLTDYLEGDLRSGNIYTEIVPLTPDNVQEYLDEGLAW